MSPSLVSNGTYPLSNLEEASRPALSELNSRLVLPDDAKRDSLSDSCPLPTLDLGPFLAQPNTSSTPAVEQLCQALAHCLSRTGCVVVKDPRVGSEDNSLFVDLMERYFSQEADVKCQDARPELHYQVCTSFPSWLQMGSLV